MTEASIFSGGTPTTCFAHSQHHLVHLREDELAARWQITVRTLQRWRRAGGTPTYLVLGRRVLYRLSDIESFEASRLRTVIDGE